MRTVRLSIAAPDALQRAVSILRLGQVVAFPTDTVYGVGAHAFLPEAVARLYAVKGRPPGMAIPLLLSDAALMQSVCTVIPPLAWILAERFWPGALSLVLLRAMAVPSLATAGGPTVAVRVPDQPLVRDICRALGAPLAATSANLHGRPAPVTADEAWTAVAGQVPLLLDGGRCPGGRASSLLDLTVTPPVLLREGPVTAEQLAAVIDLGHRVSL
jgi:L-threonylcarbamoyladenylate synthase